MRTRELVVVQVNATGNDPARHVALEVAALSLVSGKSWDFTVPLTQEQLVDADPSTLRMNGYYRRGLADRADLSRPLLSGRIADLAGALAGNTLGGTAPEESADFLARLFRSFDIEPRWHPRLADIGALTAGAFGLAATSIPTFTACCRMWGIDFDADEPSAMTTAAAAAGCFHTLDQYNAVDVLHGSEPQPVKLSVVPDHAIRTHP
ncbi:hypothetical protein [Rhodococcus erythropolis]|uniref:Uncharacterized protein n=1 Tax=Rhodococcus erythropolis TaxID=1833 RepID=A0A8I1D5F7_RHOER|nr:hypothetical protein [Rhodococcus erythropolis]MBH5141871.1 hypothetical protein [Rhodococcus erythropolis]